MEAEGCATYNIKDERVREGYIVISKLTPKTWSIGVCSLFPGQLHPTRKICVPDIKTRTNPIPMSETTQKKLIEKHLKVAHQMIERDKELGFYGKYY